MSIYFMKVEVIEEAGYDSALRGLSFNKKQTKNMSLVANKLAKKDYGHNKFLESIYLWIEVIAPRYWWQEADTFRLSTKQSESTMHTLIKELQENNYFQCLSMFENNILDEHLFNDLHSISISSGLTDSEQLVLIKQLLPEGFLQKRL